MFFLISNEDQSAQGPDFPDRTSSISVTSLCEPECADPVNQTLHPCHFWCFRKWDNRAPQYSREADRFVLFSRSNDDWRTVKESTLASRTCPNFTNCVNAVAFVGYCVPIDTGAVMACTHSVFTLHDVCPVTSSVLPLGLLNFQTSTQLLFRQGESPVFAVMRCQNQCWTNT